MGASSPGLPWALPTEKYLTSSSFSCFLSPEPLRLYVGGAGRALWEFCFHLSFHSTFREISLNSSSKTSWFFTCVIRFFFSFPRAFLCTEESCSYIHRHFLQILMCDLPELPRGPAAIPSKASCARHRGGHGLGSQRSSSSQPGRGLSLQDPNVP